MLPGYAMTQTVELTWWEQDTIVFFKECVTEKKKVLNNIRSALLILISS